jgi:toxin HigB-1
VLLFSLTRTCQTRAVVRMKLKILVSRQAKKQLKLIPDHIYRKYLYWIDLLKTVGLLKARKYKGFHDEPLRGNRK